MSLEFLSHANNIGYGRLPVPSARDNEISEVLRAWAALNEHARGETSKEFSCDSYVRTLECYSHRMASLAVRTRDQEFIYLGLLSPPDFFFFFSPLCLCVACVCCSPLS